MARTLSATLLTAQQGAKRKPYIRIVINSVDYSSRLLFVEHHEEPYRDWATIILSNKDRGLDSVATAANNLLGYRFRIGYGYVSASGNEYSEAADLWVKSQQMISSQGQLVCQLYCEGQWMFLREQLVLAQSDTVQKVESNDTPYFTDTIKDKTVYQLMQAVIVNVLGGTLNAAPSPDDGILTTFNPVYTLKRLPNAASVLGANEGGLIRMTKCFLRPKANLVWDVVYPQTSDAVNETFYSGQQPFFTEYAETINLVIPNKIVVFANNPDDKPRWPTPVMVGETADYSGNYTEVMEPHLEGTITAQADADNRAAAIFTRYQSEKLSGYLTVPHDCRVELYDRVLVVDARGK